MPTVDGIGLDPISLELAQAGATVHLRLRIGDSYPVTACCGGLGQLWSGKASEVNCEPCKEYVHA